MIGMSVFKFYHTDDMPHLKDIYELGKMNFQHSLLFLHLLIQLCMSEVECVVMYVKLLLLLLLIERKFLTLALN